MFISREVQSIRPSDVVLFDHQTGQFGVVEKVKYLNKTVRLTLATKYGRLAFSVLRGDALTIEVAD